MRGIYRNNLKNRNFDLERATIADRQGASENRNSEAKPTRSKTDSSGYFGIWLCVGLLFLDLTAELTDLEAAPQEFILEMKKIEIPEFPYAFNPSIVQVGDKILMSFRAGFYTTDSGAPCIQEPACQVPKNRKTGEVGLIWLDEDFNVLSAPKFLKMPCFDRTVPFRPQDPRLFYVGDQLYMAYNNFVKVEEHLTQRMFFAPLIAQQDGFILGPTACLTNYDQMIAKRVEKNWTPFDYRGHLRFCYSFQPLKIFQPIPERNICDLISATPSPVSWNWGEVRGGTPALHIGDRYLGFFHSCKTLKTKQSKGQNMTHYLMGAYTFSDRPPFRITALSDRPIVANGFYSGQSYVTWKPICVIFPGGFIFNDQSIWVSYGRQDHEIWVAKIDRKKLLDSLVPVPSREAS